MVERIDYYAEVSGEQPDPLWPVRAAAAAAKAADRDLRRAVRSAYGAGVGKSELSEVAGISRPTLNAWLSDGRDPRTPPESSWGQVLDEALMDLAERAGAGELETIVLEVFLPMWTILVPVSACWWCVVTATE